MVLKSITSGKLLNNAPAVDENDSIHTNMTEFAPLLEASGERNLRSINMGSSGHDEGTKVGSGSVDRGVDRGLFKERRS